MEYTIAGTLYRTREGAVAALASLILPDPEVMGDAPLERRAGGVRGRVAELVAEWEAGGPVHEDLRAMLLDTLTRRIMDAALRWRAYDVVTEWSGPPRATIEDAERDAAGHNSGCAAQGGYGSARIASPVYASQSRSPSPRSATVTRGDHCDDWRRFSNGSAPMAHCGAAPALVSVVDRNRFNRKAAGDCVFLHDGMARPMDEPHCQAPSDPR
jgi:hypothetical protein